MRMPLTCSAQPAGTCRLQPAFEGQVVAYAFGLAASSSFPVIVLGIFWRGTTAAVAEPAVARSERTI
jgi:Na+(H+)/acetate symporter ActP